MGNIGRNIRTFAVATTMLVVALFAVPLGAAATGSSSAPSCPLPAQPGAYVVDISTEHLLAWDAAKSTAGPVPFDLPAGSYDVYLVSYDDHSNKRHQAQQKESWYLVGGVGDTAVFATAATPDLPESTDIETFTVGSITTTTAIDHVGAVHAAYPDSFEPHSVVPMCAGFYPTGVSPISAECPFEPAPSVVNISDELLLAWDPDRFMAGPVPFSVPAGTYDVYLVSYDNHSAKTHQSQTREQWYLQGTGGGTTLMVTPPTGDLPENVDLAIYSFASISITSPIDQVKAIHAAYPAAEPHSVAPLCAAIVPAGSPPPDTGGSTTTTTVAGTTGSTDSTGTTATTGGAGTSGTTATTASTTATTGSTTATTGSTTATTGSTTATTGGGGTSGTTATTGSTGTTTDTTPGVSNSAVTGTSVAAGMEGNTAQSLQQLPLTGVELETAFAAIVAVMFGIVLVRRARDWQSRLDRRAARVWRRPIA